jgi:hypothetical protein
MGEIMLIKSLEQMEKIVNSRQDLLWDGWDVISLKLIDSGIMSKNTIQINGNWYIQKRFALTENGWEIPNKIVG